MKSELRSIASIYVYGDETLPSMAHAQLETWARANEPLITGVYIKSADCFPQLTKDVHDICDHDSIPVTYLNLQTKYANIKQASAFLSFHLFLNNILLSTSFSTTADDRQRALRSCLYYYRDNSRCVEEIEHFQQRYSASSAVDWYFRTRFLSRLLNKASRTLNISLLFNYRFVFRDIQRSIDESLSSSTDVQPMCIFYRAQNLNADELYRLRMNLNEILSIDRYLDLCKTKEDAINEISLTSNTLETVLYHMSLNHSFIPLSESKVLLSVGSSFRIRHIAMETDGIWHAHLNLVAKDEIDRHVQTLLDELDFIPHPYLSLSLMWEKMKQPSRADRFNRLLFDNLPKNEHETALIGNYLGAIYRLKCQYKSAMNYHQQALDIYKAISRTNSAHEADVDRTHGLIALVYRDTGDLVTAIRYLKSACKQGQEVLNHLGEIYRNLEQYPIALQYYDEGQVPNNIGLCYIYQRMFPQALTHLQQEKDSISHVNLAFYHQFRKEYSTASIFFERALEAARDQPLEAATIHSYLGQLHCDRRQWQLSLKHYELALDLFKRHLPSSNHPTIALVHDGLGSLYLSKGEYRAAQHEFEYCLELQTRVLPTGHPDIAGTYNNLGGVFNEMGQYERALLYHFEALAIATVTLPSAHNDVKLYEHNITETKRKLASH